MPTYEIAVHNAEVRRLVKQGDRHRNLSDDWGDTHYIDIKAEDLESARAKAAQRYPVEDGYEIEDIREA